MRITGKNMLGGLEIPEKKLMVVMPDERYGGPAVSLPFDYVSALKRRAGSYWRSLDPPLGYALNAKFVETIITLSGKDKPDAVYWMHWSIYGEAPLAQEKLINWILNSGVKFYVSSWGIPLSEEVRQAIVATGGGCEHSDSRNYPVFKIKTTPVGTKNIEKKIRSEGEWSESLQNETNIWEGWVISRMDDENARRFHSRETKDAFGFTFSVKGTSLNFRVPKSEIDPESWEELVNFWGTGKNARSSNAYKVVYSKKDGGKPYMIQRDAKTGQYIKTERESPEDVMKESP